MDRYGDERREYQELMSMRAELAALSFLVKLMKFAQWRKANFNPSQPRVPRGARGGGQWTNGGGGGGTHRVGLSMGDSERDGGASAQSDQDSGSRLTPVLGTDQSRPRAPTFDVPLGPVSRPRAETNTSRAPEPIEAPPEIPAQRPSSFGTRLRVTRSVAQWLLRAATLASSDPRVILIRIAVTAAEWLAEEYWPYVTAYWEEPKSLAELQNNVGTKRGGTDVHHIIEQGAVGQEGISKELVQRPENLVRISTFRHWQISGWYQTPQEELENLSPRNFLKGKSPQEHYDMGIKALKQHGIMMP